MIGDKTASKCNGVSYYPWFELVERLIKENNTELKLESNVLHNLYHEDFTPLEVYKVNRVSTAISGMVTLRWRDEFGFDEITFTENLSIRRFYKYAQKLKQVMETKKSKFY